MCSSEFKIDRLETNMKNVEKEIVGIKVKLDGIESTLHEMKTDRKREMDDLIRFLKEDKHKLEDADLLEIKGDISTTNGRLYQIGFWFLTLVVGSMVIHLAPFLK